MTISREIQIDYGHTLPHHLGFCNQLHGHRAKVIAVFHGEMQLSGSQRGMIVDFSICKRAMMETVHELLDHGFAIWNTYQEDITLVGDEKISTLDFILCRNDKVLLCKDPPTSEYLAKWAFSVIDNRMNKIIGEMKTSPIIDLLSVAWFETPNNIATAYASDFIPLPQRGF